MPNTPMGAKQDPTEKAKRSLAADGRCYFSYAQIATAVSNCVPEVEAFAPDVFVAIGGGGFIPARMLRTEVKKPILAISLELYDDATKTANETVLRKQWFTEEPDTFGALVRGKRVLIVDEVDDTRVTLQYAVEEIRRLNAPAAIGVLVVHNKLKPKKGELPADIVYIAGEHVPPGRAGGRARRLRARGAGAPVQRRATAVAEARGGGLCRRRGDTPAHAHAPLRAMVSQSVSQVTSQILT